MSNMPLKFLFVTAIYPHGPEYGAQQRVLNLCRQLAKLGKVSIFLLSPEEIDYESIERTKAEFEVAGVARVHPAKLQGLGERLRFEFDPDWLNTHFFRISDEDRSALMRLFDAQDAIFVHTLRTANECGVYHWPRTVLDIDDIPSRVYQSKMSVGLSALRRLLVARMAYICRRREQRLLRRFGSLTVCSEADRSYMASIANAKVIPNGFARPDAPPQRAPSTPPRLGFIGWFGGMPNVEGVEWFLQTVWPSIKARLPDARLRLVGGDVDLLARSAAEQDVDRLGYLASPDEEIATWSAMIIPIRIGGGTRVKAAQGFSRKCPVVATSLGVFGYDIKNGEHAVIADEPQDFATACITLIEDPQRANALAENAWNEYLAKWTWDSIGADLREVVENVVQQNAR